MKAFWSRRGILANALSRTSRRSCKIFLLSRIFSTFLRGVPIVFPGFLKSVSHEVWHFCWRFSKRLEDPSGSWPESGLLRRSLCSFLCCVLVLVLVVLVLVSTLTFLLLISFLSICLFPVGFWLTLPPIAALWTPVNALALAKRIRKNITGSGYASGWSSSSTSANLIGFDLWPIFFPSQRETPQVVSIDVFPTQPANLLKRPSPLLLLKINLVPDSL